MKCYGSPTTSTVSDRSTARTRSGGEAAEATAARDAAASFEALLLQQAFAPLAKAIGFYGDAVVAAATRAMMRAHHDGFVDMLASSRDEVIR